MDASQPAFKPRKVKKGSSQYRDRAAERRVGEGNDFAQVCSSDSLSLILIIMLFAQVEAVLEDFERQIADSEDKDAVSP
jgi:IK cytokine